MSEKNIRSKIKVNDALIDDALRRGFCESGMLRVQKLIFSSVGLQQKLDSGVRRKMLAGVGSSKKHLSPVDMQVLDEIEKKYCSSRLVSSVSDLRCPVCGGGDRGNRMNGRVWCFRCNIALVKSSDVRVRALPGRFPEVTFAPVERAGVRAR